MWETVEKKLALSEEVENLYVKLRAGRIDKRTFREEFSKTEQSQALMRTAQKRNQRIMFCSIEKRAGDNDWNLYVTFEPA